MPAVFAPSANTALRIAIGVLGAAVVSAPCALMAAMRSPALTNEDEPLEQPVMFDHRHHVRDVGIACGYCHEGAQISAFAGVPPTERCMGCHGQIWNDSVLTEKVRASFYDGRPIAWQRVNRLPDFVKFDHSSHVKRGVECATCHGHVEEMAAVRQTVPLTMRFCIDCHRERAAPTDCTTCHA